ncbi:Eukaryotic rRNA processing protein EBP2 [Spironucleus salmonicida]|uniref:Eukaryotic rRNA processing protein EBP2 n=1 Tax=Spironucleus salmonicida TaxID=348837 RepID=V6LQG4_9EUKA|nr:Eukaryotic rRNA processing protein EBP2 [Spironucleus salmonicida]|eukprot:EST42999.1 hypothetical protein SS50377_17300 [Spironucleus salmonicida]
MTEVNSSEHRVISALSSLIRKDEYYFDYLTYTSEDTIQKYDTDEELNIQQFKMAQLCVAHARAAFRKQDIPFVAPDEFETEKYRDPKVLNRVNMIESKRQKELEEAQRKHRDRLEKRQTGQKKNTKLKDRKVSKKMQNEVINKWKEARQVAKKNGMDDAKLPTLEQIENQVKKDKRISRTFKDKKYGKPRTDKRNDKSSAVQDKYQHRQFSNLKTKARKE